MLLEIQISSSLLLLLCIKHLRTNTELFLQVEWFFELFFFPEIMPESWGCGLYTSAAYTRVFTVLVHNMPAGHTKFSASWLSCVDVNNQSVGEWCRKGKDDFHGYCRFCDTDIKCDNSGKAQLLQHTKKEKHKQATKHVRSNN